jgi:hypothetical protein
VRSPLSCSTTHRRVHPAAPDRRRLEAVAEMVDAATVHEPGHVLVHVVPDDADGAEMQLGLAPLPEGEHPFTALAGVTAPPSWTVFGVRVVGTARRIHADGVGDPTGPTATTFLIDRHGHEASVLRSSGEVSILRGPAEGVVPDACRCVLGVPTAAAPPSTVGLWTLAWIDRLVATWCDPPSGGGPTTFSALASAHPALSQTAPANTSDRAPSHSRRHALRDPLTLAELGRAHAAAWPWARLRHQPAALPLPDGTLPRAITEWMDDGFYARWALGAFPPIDVLVHDLLGLVPGHLTADLAIAVAALMESPTVPPR